VRVLECNAATRRRGRLLLLPQKTGSEPVRLLLCTRLQHRHTERVQPSPTFSMQQFPCSGTAKNMPTRHCPTHRCLPCCHAFCCPPILNRQLTE
jgi:hypothetical protein